MKEGKQVTSVKSATSEELEALKHKLGEGDDSASYCCESAEVVSVDNIPEEAPFD